MNSAELKITKISWTELRRLIKNLSTTQENFISNLRLALISELGFAEAEIFVFDSSENDRDALILKLSESQFFSEELFEDIFINKEPYVKSETEFVLPLEVQDRIIGILYLSSPELNLATLPLLWSFADLVSYRFNELESESVSQAKIDLKNVSDTIFNNLKGFLEASLQKIKDLEDQNNKLLELNKTRTELISNVSHELRTPLVSIMGFSKMLQRHEISHDLIDEASEQIQSAGGRLSRMIDDLIQLNRASTRGWETQIEKVDVAEITKYIIDSLSPLNKDHNFVCEFPEQSRLINSDRKLLRQVIENLLLNAVKYSPDGGNITCRVAVEEEQNLYQLSIIDEGIGMTEEENAQIFDRFFRAKNALTENIPGLGLGLTICKDVVQALGGSITAQSQFGEGSTFSIDLKLN